MHDVSVLSLSDSVRGLRFVLWDEDRNRMVTIGETQRRGRLKMHPLQIAGSAMADRGVGSHRDALTPLDSSLAFRTDALAGPTADKRRPAFEATAVSCDVDRRRVTRFE
jgi:hypothetical protein